MKLFSITLAALGSLILAGCAADAAQPRTDASLRTSCQALADREHARHGADALAELPAICARLEATVAQEKRAPGSPARRAAFDADYERCVDAAKHRGAMFSYRSHPGDPDTYRRVRAVCEAFAANFAAAGR